MYTFDQEQEKITRTRTANRSTSRFTPGYVDEEEQQSFLPFGEEDTTSTNEAQEYNRVSSFTDINQDEERHMYIQTLQQEKSQKKKTFRLNARGKIAICVFSIIFAALLAFSIYNAVLIGELNTSVALKNQAVANQTAVINNLQAEYNELSVDVDEGISMGYREATDADIVEVVSTPKATKTTTEVESNWFDKLCEFFSKLFG